MTCRRLDMTLLRAALVGRAAEIAIALLGEPNPAMSTKRELRFGRHGSVAVMIGGPKAGMWHDHEVGAGGDVLALIMRQRCGGFRDAIEYAEHFLGQAPSKFVRIKKRRRAPAGDDAMDGTRRALNLWHEAGPIAGTIAERYPASRGIFELAPGVDGEALRFHPRCPWRNDAGDIVRVPALIGLFRDIHTDAPRAIHRRALTIDGQKIGKPKALGPKSGAAIKLGPEVTHHLTIGEGLETTLSGMALGYMPAWAIGDVGELSAFPVLAGVESLTILVDNDKSGTGQAAALACSAQWTAGGREVFRLVPQQTGADVNDLLLARAFLD
jgi:Toprim domain